MAFPFERKEFKKGAGRVEGKKDRGLCVLSGILFEITSPTLGSQQMIVTHPNMIFLLQLPGKSDEFFATRVCLRERDVHMGACTLVRV